MDQHCKRQPVSREDELCGGERIPQQQVRSRNRERDVERVRQRVRPPARHRLDGLVGGDPIAFDPPEGDLIAGVVAFPEGKQREREGQQHEGESPGVWTEILEGEGRSGLDPGGSVYPRRQQERSEAGSG